MPDQFTTKTCTKCGGPGPFGRDKGRRDGLFPWCKACVSADQRRRYAADPGGRSDRSRADYAKNRERVLARVAARYAADPEVRAAHVRDARKWQQANPGKHGAAAKRYRLAHPEVYRKATRDFYWRNRVAQIADAKIRKARRKGAPGWATPEQIAARFELWGWRCWLGLAGCTGEPETIDHVIAVSRGGTNWPANLRPACKKCNGRKHARDWRAFV